MTAQPPATHSNALIATVARRALGVAKLDARVLREIRDDSEATSQALFVMLLVAIVGAFGGAANAGLSEFLGLFVMQIVLSVCAWALFAGLADFVGTEVIPSAHTDVSAGQALRTLGYADAPGLLLALGFIPAIGPFVAVIGFVWVLVAQVVALRTTFETTTGHAIAIAVIAGALTAVVLSIALLLLAAVGVSFF